MSDTYDFTPEEMQERAEHLRAMKNNQFMRNSGVLDEKQLDDFLTDAHVTGNSHESQFIGFMVFFGFDRLGRDFVAIKDLAAQGAHVVFTAKQ